jgi:hypothetical protein
VKENLLTPVSSRETRRAAECWHQEDLPDGLWEEELTMAEPEVQGAGDSTGKEALLACWAGMVQA